MIINTLLGSTWCDTDIGDFVIIVSEGLTPTAFSPIHRRELHDDCVFIYNV